MARKYAYLAAVGLGLAIPAHADTVRNPLGDSATWQELRGDVIGEITPGDADGFLRLDAPYRAHDAATVPIILKQTEPGVDIDKATVVVDENPAPVAGTFTFSDAMAPLDFELRVRVDQYSNVRVITESDQGVHMTGRFVKASGGCSAPASRDPEVALAGMGKMKLRSFAGSGQMSTARREAQIMIRHPNYSGLQRDQITQLFIPAHFIDHIEVFQGEDLLFSMEGGISISENPVFRFAYDDNGATTLTVKATDTDGNVFESVLPKSAES